MLLLFIETPLFSRLVGDYLNDDEYSKLQSYLSEFPEKGDVVPGSGGVRKLRWGSAGRGKRGGLRVIYYFKSAKGEVWMLTLYGKSVQEVIPSHILRQIREEIENG